MHLVSGSKDIAIGEHLDRLETLGGASLGGAEIDALLVAIVVVHIKVTLQVAVALKLFASIDVERGHPIAQHLHNLESTTLFATIKDQRADIGRHLQRVHIDIGHIGGQPLALHRRIAG